MARDARTPYQEKPEPWYFEAEEPSAALHLRRDFVRYLQSYGRPFDSYADAEAIFGELVGNVLLHANGPIEILVEWPLGQATLYVTDDGPPIDLDAPAPADPYDEHGRGLMIVRMLSPAVTSTVYPGFGKMVGARLPVRERQLA